MIGGSNWRRGCISVVQYLKTPDNAFKVITLVLALIVAIVNYELWADQAAHNIADQRPWLSTKPVLREVRLNEKIAAFTMQFNLENVGRSPAFRAWVSWRPIAISSDDMNEIRGEQKASCKSGLTDVDAGSDFILPGGKVVSGEDRVAPVLVRREIKDRKNRDTESFRRRNAIEGNSIIGLQTNFYVVGCTNYRFSNDGNVHQTSFIYQIVEQPKPEDKGKTPDRVVSFGGSVNGTFSAEDLALRSLPLGTFAN